jgi:hypothetical protein
VTRDQRLERLRMELKLANDGVFVVLSDRSPVLDGTTIPLDRLLDTTDIGSHLNALPGQGPIEVSANEGVTDEMLRSLNHRRDQLQIGRPILLVFDPSDSARISRIADDLWKWATLVELDRADKTWEHTAARGVVDSDRYAPALQPSDVVGPKGPLTAPPEETIS